MHIKSMIIDGFKSYGDRTEIKGFDPLFNAITGLNGSGKSNILDGICFLLGITNLSQVRATTNLQDLVFKNGQAGITKASVSITFDNRAKEKSPIGYTRYDEITITREITVGGKNRYYVNEMNASSSNIQDLFHSVQLNVNNPHFLIMQGKITKMISMKPLEILSMMEEAAGTKMFKIKKIKSEETLVKKDDKLKEIDNILSEDIEPTLRKLKDDRAQHLNYQKIQRDIDRLTKLRIAYEFVCAEEAKKEANGALETSKIGLQFIKEKSEKTKKELEKLELEINALKKQNSEETELNLALEEFKKKQVSESKAASNLNYMMERLNAEEKKKQNLQKNLVENSLAIQHKQNELDKMENEMQDSRKKNQENVDCLTVAIKRLQAVNTGLSSNPDGEDATLANQLITTKSELATTETEIKRATMKLTHLKTELEKKRNELDHSDPVVENRKHFDLLQTQLVEIRRKLTQLEYSEQVEMELMHRRHQLSLEYNRLSEKIERLKASTQLNFNYDDPEPNFDRRKVYGLVCTLFRVIDVNKATAIEATAGSKLYDVVVDCEETARKLLEKGKLRKRVSMIPLNKILPQSIPKNVVEKAEEIGGKSNVFTALSLTSYDDQSINSVMEFVFGSTFICSNLDIAKKVAFHPEIKKRTVTFDGEVFDPAGTLSGGSRKQSSSSSSSSSSVLIRVEELRRLKFELEEKQRELTNVDQRLHDMKHRAESYHNFEKKFDKKKNEAEILQQKLQQNQHYRTVEEIKSLEHEIGEHEAVVSRCLNSQERLANRVKELEDKIRNMSATRENELKIAEDEVTKSKKNMELVRGALMEKEKEVNVFKLEIEELNKEVKSLRQQLSRADSIVEEIKEKCQQARENSDSIKDDARKAMEDVEVKRKVLDVKREKIRMFSADQDMLEKLACEQSQGMTIGHRDIEDQKRVIQKFTDKLTYLTNKHEWIEEEKIYFGQPNTAYDFKVNKPNEDMSQQLAELEEKKNKFRMSNIFTAFNEVAASVTIEKVEEKYKDLMKKKQIVKKDKSKIRAAIKKLDTKRHEALVQAWKQINRNFGSIFSTLLPGGNVKLDLLEGGKSIQDGLKVKVAFGNIWKESLDELSGGQRSLVALSFVLSMLLFKPAPIYILDEVDAALDISNIQNMGNMLKTHFKQSQFIVISLRDGMFNNANVLFKTILKNEKTSIVRLPAYPSNPPPAPSNPSSSSYPPSKPGCSHWSD